MSLDHRVLCTVVIALFLAFGIGNGQMHQRFSRQPLGYRTIVVEKSGKGNFTTIQAAIDSVPWNNDHWICIYVKAGEYKEKVMIPKEKQFIYLKGEGKKSTNIVWNDHASVVQSATFTSFADNFFAKSISFTNSYNLPVLKNGNSRAPAVAAMIGGDKSSFYRCGFFGVQDTLWDFEGRHYFKHCTIAGAVDFIFGSGQSIYEKCTIAVTALALGPGLPGYITAQGRSDPEQTNGFVFKECNLIGSGMAYLGRPWRGYARVIFYNTSMSDIIVPQGWDAWYTANHEFQLTFAEVDCNGVGANTAERVKWVKKQLNPTTLSELTSLDYIGASDWIKTQPFSRILL